MIYKIFKIVLVCLAFAQSMFVVATSIVPDTKSSAVTMDKAANGVPVIQIIDPNPSGVSHNKFLDFSVGAQGAVVNNSIKIKCLKLVELYYQTLI